MRMKLIFELVYFLDLSFFYLEMDYIFWFDLNFFGGYWLVFDGRLREGFVVNYYWNVWLELLG